MAYETEHAIINGDANNTQTTANLLSSGVTLVGALATSSDVDYFKITPASAGLLQLSFSNSLLTSTNHWEIALLDGNGDYLTTLASSVSSALTVSGSENTGTSLAVAGNASVPANARFTLATSSADTTIYTVTNTTSVSGTGTLALNKALPSTAPTDGASLVFDPAQSLADGGSTSLTGQISAAGTYYVKVSASTWTDSEYSLVAGFVPTVESSGANDTKANAATNNNRLIANAWMSGNLSASTDKDVWLLTTADASDIYLDFAAATGDNSAPQWNITIAEWANDAPVTTAGSVAVSGSAGASKTFQPNSGTPTIDDGKYTTANTFVITVEKLSGATLNTGTYTLRARGTDLDLNDAPVITVDTVSSAAPNSVINTGVVRAIAQGADSKVRLNTLFSVSDTDSGQSVASYKIALATTTGSSAVGSIKIEPSGGTATTYTNGATMTAAQMADAWLYPGTTTGDLTLTIQAFDNSAAPDSSGASSFMIQTVRVASSAVGLTVAVQGSDSTLDLVEKAISTDTGYSETFTVKLNTLPSADVKVYLEQASPSQLTLSTGLLTFTASNGTTAQTVTVRAVDDGTTEGSHTGQITFRVVSTDSTYDGQTLTPLSVSLSDPVNHAMSGTLTVSGTATEDQTLTAVTTGLADTDGLGVFAYEWQRSSDGSTGWSAIANATQSSYALGDADVGKYIRAKVSYTDGIGTLETATSAATTAIANINDTPTTSNVTVTTNEDTAYTFSLSNFAFSDNDSGDALTKVWLQELPALGTIKYNGTAIALAGGEYELLKDNIGNLTYTPGSNGNGATYTTFDFKVADATGAKSLAKTVTVAVTAVDDAYTGSLAITGSAAVGRTLEASDAVSDADGIPASGTGAKAYQWLANDVAISGATSASYALTGSEQGKTVKVKLTYTDNGGTANTITSAATTAVAAAGNSAPTGAPAISDTTPAEDQALTASQGDLADTNTLGTLSYQWQRSSSTSTGWGDISGANTANYTPGDADVGQYLRVVASYTDGQGQAESVASAATAAVTNVNDAPTLVSAILDQAAAIGVAFSYTVPLATFGDVDNTTLTYSATQSNDTALPDWLSFTASTRKFTGTPPVGATTVNVKVTASDGVIGSTPATDTFALTINTAPTLSAVSAASYTDTSAYDSSFANTSGTLTGSDSDSGDTLTYGISGGTPGGTTAIGGVTYDVSKTGSYGTLYVVSADATHKGKYVYVPSVSAINARDSSTSENFTFTVTDGTATASQTFAVNITAVTDLGYTINGTIRHWKDSTKKMTGVSITESSISDETGSDGMFTLSGVTDSDGTSGDGIITLAPTLTAPANKTAAGVSLTDVLAALKVYLGKSLPTAYESPYKYIASDFDGNGQVQLTDVLQLLKYYLGKATTNNVAPAWVFMDAADQTGTGMGTSFMGANDSALGKTNTAPHAIDQNFGSNNSIELVAVLRGDVDGSWAALS